MEQLNIKKEEKKTWFYQRPVSQTDPEVRLQNLTSRKES